MTATIPNRSPRWPLVKKTKDEKENDSGEKESDDSDDSVEEERLLWRMDSGGVEEYEKAMRWA